MKTLAKILASPARCGVYRSNQAPDEVESQAGTAGLLVFRADLADIKNKQELFAALSAAMNFPSWFGHNWDALHDCMTDFSWFNENGYILHLVNVRPFADIDPEDLSTALEVFETVTEFWSNVGTPFWVLIQGEKDWRPSLKDFSTTQIRSKKILTRRD